MQLTATTNPERVKAHYDREGTLLAFEIPRTTGRSDLERIVRLHARWPQRDGVLELVVGHPRCDPSTLELVLELAEGSAAVLSCVATSGKASRDQLIRLTRSDILSVRERAQFALVDLQLSEADDDGIARIYEEYRDHRSWGYGLRYRLAIDSRTPRGVLESIAAYPDPVGAQARRRLGHEATG